MMMATASGSVDCRRSSHSVAHAGSISLGLLLSSSLLCLQLCAAIALFCLSCVCAQV